MLKSLLSFTLLLFCIFFFSPVQASPFSGSDDNIILTSSVETYRYEYAKARGTVEVKAEVVNRYTCRNYREKGAFFSFFDDQTTLDAVELYENGSKGFAHKELKDYSIEDCIILNFPFRKVAGKMRCA
jgi:hypothetical protein